MAKWNRKLLSVVLLIFVFVQMLPCIPAAAASEQVYYGEAYNDLQKEEHRIAYRMIEEGIASLSPIIEFRGIVDINYKEMMKVIRAVCVDHPQYFWFLEEGKYVYDDLNGGYIIVSFEPKYILDGKEIAVGSQELIDAMYAFHTKVQQIINGIPVNYTTEYEIALYLHDYLVENVTYTLEGEHPSAYAALIHGQAACYGYSKAYQCLLNAAGIRARTITGNSIDENGDLQGHAWNQIWLDGNCYYADVTWDDFDQVIMHACFAMSLEQISRDHVAEKEFILPSCDHDAVNYHAIEHGAGVGHMNSRTTAAEAASCFQHETAGSDATVFSCEIRYVGNDFLNWLERNCFEICQLLGLSNSTSVYYYELYDVYYVSLVDVNYQQSSSMISNITLSQETVALTGPGTRFQLQPQIETDTVWTPELIYSSSDPAVAIVDHQGLVTAVSEGTAVIMISSQDETVSVCCTITVTPEPKHVHTMRLFTTKMPTCNQDGHETYYLCTGCGRRFADEAAVQEFTDPSVFVLPATGHVDISWVKRFDFHVWQCKCGENMGPSKEKHYDKDGDEICDACDAPMPAPASNQPAATKENASSWILLILPLAAIPVGMILFFVIRRHIRGY